MKPLRLLVAASVMVAALAGCSDEPDPGPGEARLTGMSGRVEVSRDGRTWETAKEGLLRRGERVRVRGAGSEAALELNRGGIVDLRGGSHVAVGTPLRLVAGEALVQTRDAPVRVDGESATTEVSRGSAARLARGLAFDTGVYQGTAIVRSVGRPALTVPALRQAGVAGPGLVPRRALPLRLRNDRWDREFLAEWIDLGRDLEARSQGLTGQVGPDEGRTAGFYRLLLPPLEREPAFDESLLAQPSVPAVPGERLVGAAIAVAGESGGFAERWGEVFEFRADGAAWGLVAADQRVRNRPRLVGDVDQALARAVTGPQVASGDVTPTTQPGPATSPGSTGGATTATTTPSSGGPGTTTPPTTVPPGTPTTEPPVEPVLPPLPEPTLPPPPDDGGSADQGGTLDQLTDNLVDTVGGLLGSLPQ